MEIPFSHVLLFFVVLVSSHNPKSNLFCYADPTDGFTELTLTDANFELQKPYNIPLEERYSFVDGVHKFWIYANDKPHDPSSNTQPHRSSDQTLIPHDLDYSSGVWQIEGHGFLPNGTSGTMIAQIHGAAHGNITLILRIYDGDMRYYSKNLIATGLYERWFRLNIINDVDGGKVTMFLDTNQCGLYGAPANICYYMESRWRDIKIYKK
ncbi:hypothetical protein BT93_F1941 [Corymbia citriodora subsp. variegata]|nr:hypothetical protein BT93_F1941 [Corymbia citriodora subsp. variegata]